MFTRKISDNTVPHYEEERGIVVYSQPGCGKCAVIKNKLQNKGVSYRECESVVEMVNLGLKSTPAVKTENGELIKEFIEINKWVESL